jgi:hypothetical protein
MAVKNPTIRFEIVCSSLATKHWTGRNNYEPQFQRNADFPVSESRRLENRRYEAGQAHRPNARPRLGG